MHNRKSQKTWVLKILLEKMLLEIPNPIVSILIDSIALVDKIFQLLGKEFNPECSKYLTSIEELKGSLGRRFPSLLLQKK